VIDALVFAAGLGTRLRPLTDLRPKALVEVGGMSVLERTVRRIIELRPGVIVVNAHHHADQIEAEVARLNSSIGAAAAGDPGAAIERDSGGDGAGSSARILVSLEKDRPLETGGGLRQAAPLFGERRSVLLHNADVVTEFDLATLVSANAVAVAPETGAPVMATLAVQDRPSGRKLLFDERGLFGRLHVNSGNVERARKPVGASRALAFSGVHVVSPELIESLPATEVFSITDHYLDLARDSRVILPFDMGSAGWWEIGTPERLAAARSALGQRTPG